MLPPARAIVWSASCQHAQFLDQCQSLVGTCFALSKHIHAQGAITQQLSTARRSPAVPAVRLTAVVKTSWLSSSPKENAAKCLRLLEQA